MNIQRYVVGRRAVAEALESALPLEKIFLSYGVDDAPLNRIRAQADRRKVPCATMDRRKFQQLERDLGVARNDAQGVIALRPVRDPVTLEQLLTDARAAAETPLLVVLDGITDPHNLGAIARSAEAAGAAGLIIPELYTAPVTPTAVKASAGALEHLPLAKVQRVSTALAACAEAGWTIIGTAVPATDAYDAVDYSRPTIIVIGSEGEGLHQRVLDQCHHVVEIPMQGRIGSLNASVAAGVVLFEVVRQRRARS